MVIQPGSVCSIVVDDGPIISFRTGVRLVEYVR